MFKWTRLNKKIFHILNVKQLELHFSFILGEKICLQLENFNVFYTKIEKLEKCSKIIDSTSILLIHAANEKCLSWLLLQRSLITWMMSLKMVMILVLELNHHLLLLDIVFLHLHIHKSWNCKRLMISPMRWWRIKSTLFSLSWCSWFDDNITGWSFEVAYKFPLILQT